MVDALLLASSPGHDSTPDALPRVSCLTVFRALGAFCSLAAVVRSRARLPPSSCPALGHSSTTGGEVAVYSVEKQAYGEPRGSSGLLDAPRRTAFAQRGRPRKAVGLPFYAHAHTHIHEPGRARDGVMAGQDGGALPPLPRLPAVSSPMAADSQPSDDDESDRQSLTESVVEFPVEWGRSYHRYKEDSYLYPNDADERERMNLQLECAIRILHGQLFLAPLRHPEKILDIGTGTGMWAIEVADAFPHAKVIGTDLSPIQPADVPPNVFFEVSDCTEDDWGLKLASFDLIHTSFMIGSLSSFADLVTTAKRYLKPGTGWLECMDLDIGPFCDDGSMPPDWPVVQYVRHLTDASKLVVPPRPLDTAQSIVTWMQRAGYVDVHERVDKVPYNPWPKDPFLKQLGRDWEKQLIMGLAGWSYKPLGERGLGWTREKIEVFLIDVRKAVKNRYVHAYGTIHVVCGRRPSEVEERQMGRMPAPPGRPSRARPPGQP